MRLVRDPKARGQLAENIEHYAHSIELWLRKLGYTPEEREAWWQEKAEKSKGELDWRDGLQKRGPRPVDLEPETGRGMTYRPGRVSWTRPYAINLSLGHFPFDYPLNNASVAELQKHGIRIRIDPDGTGFTYETGDPQVPTDLVKARLLEIGNLLVSEKGDEDDEEDGLTDFCEEDVGLGGPESAGCRT